MQKWHIKRWESLEEGMATHFSILAWKISWTEEPGGLQSMGSQESDTTQWLNNSSNFRTILQEQQQDGQFQQKSHHQWIQWRRQQLYLSFEPRSLEESNQFHLLDLTWNKNMVKNKRKCPCFHYKKKRWASPLIQAKHLTRPNTYS